MNSFLFFCIALFSAIFSIYSTFFVRKIYIGVIYSLSGYNWGGVVTIFKNRRNEFEIIQQLLSLSLLGTKKTRLMYQTNMCYAQFNDYLSCLIEKKFIEPRNGNPHGTVYFTTEKGQKLLESVTATLLLAK